MILFLLFIDAVIGFVSHALAPFIERRFGDGWRQLVSYTCGVLFVAPILAAIEYVLTGSVDKTRAQVTKYFFTFGAFGVGNFLARVI